MQETHSLRRIRQCLTLNQLNLNTIIEYLGVYSQKKKTRRVYEARPMGQSCYFALANFLLAKNIIIVNDLLAGFSLKLKCSFIHFQTRHGLKLSYNNDMNLFEQLLIYKNLCIYIFNIFLLLFYLTYVTLFKKKKARRRQLRCLGNPVQQI